jgi:hypothetical protein
MTPTTMAAKSRETCTSVLKAAEIGTKEIEKRIAKVGLDMI